jgi:hypothetical protein
MNKKVLIMIGVGVLLYLWYKGYFKSKKTPLGVAETPADVPIVDEVSDQQYFDVSDKSSPVSPLNTQTPEIMALNEEVIETSTYDASGGDMFNESVLATGGRSFGHVRRMR